MMDEIALTIKPTMNCNMKCKHCFNGDILRESKIIDIEKTYNFIESACKEYHNIKVTFHGGEPTLAGVDFFKHIFTYENKMTEKYGSVFSNNITTNGTLLSDKLIDLLIKNNVMINISFDGPYNYILRGNSNVVYNNICKVKQRGGKFRVFCTLAKGSYEHLLEIYKWFNSNEINFKILPIEPRGYAASDRDLLMDVNKFIEVLTETYKYWIKDKDCKITFYTFEEFARLRKHTQFKPFWFNREIALNPDGKIYPFGRPNDIQFCLGDASQVKKLSKLFKSAEYARMLKVLENYHRIYCKSCSASKVCNGVCICMSYMYVKERELLEYSCNQSRSIFDGILSINNEIQNDFNNRLGEEYNNFIQRLFLVSDKDYE